MSMNYLEKELYEKIKADNEIFEFLQEAALDGIWYWDLEDPENEWLSPSFWKTLGYDPKEKIHSSSEWQSIIHPSDLKTTKENFDRHVENPKFPYDQIVRYTHRNGSTVWIRCKGLAIRNSEGKAIRMLGAHIDVTDLMNSHSRLTRIKNEYETVFNGSQDALFLIEVKGFKQFRFIRNNIAHQKTTGISEETLQGKSPYDLLGDIAGEEVASHYQECVDKKAVVIYEETLHLPSGTKLWHTTLTPTILEKEVTHIVGSAVDITERKQMEEQLEKRANFDTLTSLANRDYLTRRIDQCTTDLNKQFVFLFIDLDKFKEINDSYGHAVGDQVLKDVAVRLLKATTKEDLVSRLGGDEFVILKCDIYDRDEVDSFKKELIAEISKPYDIEGYRLNISASIGEARFPLDGLNYDQLSRRADHRMYSEKNDSNKR